MLIKISNQIKVTNQKVTTPSNEKFGILSFTLISKKGVSPLSDRISEKGEDTEGIAKYADSNVKSLIYNPKDTFLECRIQTSGDPLNLTQAIYINQKETSDYKPKKELIGLLISQINIIQKSFTDGFSRSLILEGVGFKVNRLDNHLIFNLGYACSHRIVIPSEIREVEIKNVGDNIKITSFSDSFHGLNLFMSKIKEIKPIKKQPKVKSKGFRWDH